MADSTCTDPAGVADIYHPPVKYSVEIAGHKTSVSLEPVFWRLLTRAAERMGIPRNALIARIDAQRIVSDSPPGLAGALRLWLVADLANGSGSTDPSGRDAGQL